MKDWHLKNTYRNYTSKEVLDILQEEHRLCSFIDWEVDDEMEITPEITIYNWRTGMNFLPWKELYKSINIKFKIDQPYSVWKKAFSPEGKRSVRDMCVFISQHAKKEVINPISIFGKECLDAAVFLTLKQNLSDRGIEVERLRPSTKLINYLNIKNFPIVMAEIVLKGVRTFDFLKFRIRKDISFWRKINIFDTERYYPDTGSIKTFGDLSRKIANEYELITN